MAIPESQLETWSHQGSVTQSSETDASVRSALLDSKAAYKDKRFEVFIFGLRLSQIPDYGGIWYGEITSSHDGEWLEEDYFTGRGRETHGTARMRRICRERVARQVAAATYRELNQ